ncbi:MAG TPA: hypothetical protein VM008_15860 [Phycisphaerae bacterium]|nr:hypothetical protein [Phycisphaerae bacterium]
MKPPILDFLSIGFWHGEMHFFVYEPCLRVDDAWKCVSVGELFSAGDYGAGWEVFYRASDFRRFGFGFHFGDVFGGVLGNWAFFGEMPMWFVSATILLVCGYAWRRVRAKHQPRAFPVRVVGNMGQLTTALREKRDEEIGGSEA